MQGASKDTYVPLIARMITAGVVKDLPGKSRETSACATTGGSSRLVEPSVRQAGPWISVYIQQLDADCEALHGDTVDAIIALL